MGICESINVLVFIWASHDQTHFNIQEWKYGVKIFEAKNQCLLELVFMEPKTLWQLKVSHMPIILPHKQQSCNQRSLQKLKISNFLSLPYIIALGCILMF